MNCFCPPPPASKSGAARAGPGPHHLLHFERLRAETVARRDEWIRRLRHAKQVAIKVSLGHAKQTTADRDATRAGQRLFKRGIRREMFT